MYEQIRYEQRGATRLITIDRPERMNAIGPVTSRELIDAWGRFRDDDEARVAVITGAGESAFCAGADLKAAAAGFSDQGDEEPLVRWTPEEVEAHNRGERDGIIGPSRWTDIYKPIIAAVNGVAYAGGLEWACFADIRIADRHASFGVTCRRWNIGLGDGGTQRLPRIVGMGRAMELIITGRVIGADEAERIGLVNEVTPERRMLGTSAGAGRGDRRAAPAGDAHRQGGGCARLRPARSRRGCVIEAQCFNQLLTSPEMTEGIRRFVERDHPDRDPSGGSVTRGLARGRSDG